MRQGCPIAAYLYILQSEPLAQTIRKSKHISGISLPSNITDKKFEAKISSFADDTQLFHTTEKSILEGFKILDTYCKASGAMLNLKKTKGLYLGRWKNKNAAFKKIKWVKNACGLGVQFGFNINYEDIWMQKFAKFKNKIDTWKRKLLINSYIVSSISYLIDILSANVSPEFVKQTKELIRDFL